MLARSNPLPHASLVEDQFFFLDLGLILKEGLCELVISLLIPSLPCLCYILKRNISGN